jgi:predicted neuraminidase
MKRLVFLFLTFSLLSLSCFLKAQEKADSLLPATILQPVPPEHADDQRPFQGIPSMTATPNGRLWATWYTGGITEGDENIVIIVTSSDAGKTWSKPLFAVDIPGPVRAYDPSMWTDPNGNVWLFWAQSHHWWDGRSGVWCMTTDSGDSENAQWSKPRRICDGIMMCKPIADSKNRWILPVAVWNIEPDHPNRTLPPGAHFVVSEDKGITWQSLGYSTIPRKDALFDEHNIVEKKDGSFWLLHRTKYGIAESVSTDTGKTWSEAKPSIYPHTSSRFFVRRLKSGNLLFVKHGGITQLTGRSHLQAFISDDDGKSWKGGLMLDERNGISYPDGDQTKDGTIFIIYDFDRTGAKEILMARFTEEDILAGKIVAQNSELRLLVNKATAVHPQFKAHTKTLEFEPASNSDGKPLRFGNSPTLELKKAETDIFKKDAKLFTNRDYKLLNYPKELEGKKFVRNEIQGIEVVCTGSGILYVFTPLPNRNKDNVTKTLLKSGFEKVAVPEMLFFGNYTGNIVSLYQKEIKEGEIIKLGIWSVIVY